MHKRLLLVSLVAALGCSRPRTSPVAHASAPAIAPPTAAIPAPRREDDDEEQEGRIMEALRDAAEFPPTDDGLRAIVTEYVAALGAHDVARMRHVSEQMEPDQTRMELVFTFEGNRALAARALSHSEDRWRALRAELAALRAPVAVTLTSALGSALADGSPHGLDPHMPALAGYVRPQVRFYMVTVRGADGAHVDLSPIAFAAGHWTWLAEPWSWLPPAVGPATGGVPRSSATETVGQRAR